MEKIARICWNTNNRERPSGSYGKSTLESSYENFSGYGYEEWLLDNSKIMPNGYHYGYLRPFELTAKYVDQKIDIHLFSISPRKQKIYIGCLHNAVCVSTEEEKEVYAYYKKMGWIEQMKDDIVYANGITKGFRPIFNVKFKFGEASILHSNQPIIKTSLGHRYNLMNLNEPLEFECDDDGEVVTLDTSLIHRSTKGGEIVIDPLHKKIQNAIAEILKNDYVHLYLEKSDELIGQRVDMKGILKGTKDCWHYYEIKTYSAKRSIREALWQILEYCHYPNMTRAKKMIIVGPMAPDDKDIKYLKKLREMYNVPIYFRYYSFEENKLYEEI